MRKPIALIVSIPKPCSEPWEAMTPVAGGRHCASCRKTVTDFSDWSDAAIAAFLQKPENAAACGRYHASQLDRPLYLPYQPHSLLYRWVAAAGLAAITLTALPADAQSRHHPAPTPHQSQVPAVPPVKPDSSCLPLSTFSEIEKLGGMRATREIISVQTGIFPAAYKDDIHIGGARSESVVYIVDGLLQTAPPPAPPLPAQPYGAQTLTGDEADRLHLRSLEDLPK